MYDVKDFLERALIQQKNLLKVLEKRLKTLPEGKLSVSRKKGKKYYCKHKDGKRTYLGKEDLKEIQDLQLRKLLDEMTSRIKDNEILIGDFIKRYKEPSPYAVEADLGLAYQNETFDSLSLNGNKNSKDWGNLPYRRNNAYPERRTQKTLKGDFVRSKSEVIIANTYFTKEIQYRCEELIKVGDKIFAPDFSILVPRLNKIKYHEHFGMMHDKQYRDKALQKISTYIEAGYRPYEDIIFTFDDLDGNINAQVLDSLINTFCV